MSGPDGYGKENPIPVGLQYSLPLSSESDDVEIIDSLDNKTYLQIWNNFKVVCLGMTSIMVVLNKAKYFSVVTKSQVIHLFQKTEIEYIPIYQSTKK